MLTVDTGILLLLLYLNYEHLLCEEMLTIYCLFGKEAW
jgi:hypothetical protein